jgi:multidrug efflux pump subunit AcrB
VGADCPQCRVWFDPDKLAANKLTITDVMPVIREEIRRAADLEALKAVVIKADKEKIVRLEDVCKMETAEERESAGLFRRSDKDPVSFPAVLLLVHPSLGKADSVGKALTTTLTKLEKELPRDVTLGRWTFGANTPTVTLQLPDAASLRRKVEAARGVGEQLMMHKSVGDVIWFVRASDSEAIVIPLPTKSGKDTLAVGELLASLDQPTALMRLRKGYDPVAPWPGSYMDRTVLLTRETPVEKGQDPELLDVAEMMASDLAKVKGVVDVSAELRGRTPQLSFELDPFKAHDLGLRLDEVAAIFGPISVNDFNRFGRTWQVNVRSRDDLQGLKIRSKAGDLLPLTAICRDREETGPNVILRLDGQRGAVVSWNVRGMDKKDVDKAARKVLNNALPKNVTPHWLD